MISPPQVIQTTALQTASLHIIVPRNEIQHVMGPGLQEIFSLISAQGLSPAGPWFTHHRRRPTDSFDFGIHVPVAAPITASGRVTPSGWPAMTVARTAYCGPYEGLAEAWGEFLDWITAGHHQPAPDLWERYLSGPESSPDPADWHTELNLELLST